MAIDTNEDNRQIYVFDGGYGKWKSDTGEKATAIAHTKSSNRDNPNVFEKDGKYYLFGDAAIDNAISTADGFSFFQKFVSNMVLIDMVEAGININKPIVIKTGMTLLDNKLGNPKKLVEELSNISATNKKGEEFKLDITVELYVQGQGILYDYFANSTEEKLFKSGRVIVIDLGSRSFDFLVYDNGKFVSDLSWANEIGANIFISEFREYLVDISEDKSITNALARESFISGTINLYGEQIDVTAKALQLAEKYTTKIATLLEKENTQAFRTANKIIVGGGGANIVSPEKLRDYNPRMFNQAVTPREPLSMSNYRGYKAGVQG